MRAQAIRAVALVAAVLTTSAFAGEVRYLALGDSFTIGTGSSEKEAFPTRLKALLEKQPGQKVKLLNPAVNGYSTKELIEDELPVVKDFKPTLVTVAVGANDIVRGRGPDGYRANLKTIFTSLAADGVPGKALVAIPQPDWSKSPSAAAFGLPDSLRVKIEAYNAILADEVKAAGGRYLDLWPLMTKQADDGKVATDGLHPSAAAHAEWAQALAKELGSKPPAKP